MTWKLGDTIKLEKQAHYEDSLNENVLAYVIAGELPPSCIVEHEYVTLTTQAMVDWANVMLDKQ